MAAWLSDATNIALIAFILFFVLLWRLNVHTMILKALDARSQEIAKELHEARRLREEAESEGRAGSRALFYWLDHFPTARRRRRGECNARRRRASQCGHVLLQSANAR
jgi:hypothetical protein